MVSCDRYEGCLQTKPVCTQRVPRAVRRTIVSRDDGAGGENVIRLESDLALSFGLSLHASRTANARQAGKRPAPASARG